jgi:hypothetical protein
MWRQKSQSDENICHQTANELSMKELRSATAIRNSEDHTTRDKIRTQLGPIHTFRDIVQTKRIPCRFLLNSSNPRYFCKSIEVRMSCDKSPSVPQNSSNTVLQYRLFQSSHNSRGRERRHRAVQFDNQDHRRKNKFHRR